MTDSAKEKLVELLGEAHSKATDADLFNGATYAQQLEAEADHLIAHGVTVRKWIPVTERMPEPKDNPVLVCHLGGVCIAWKLCNCWVLPSEIKTIEATHWMPLPEPPKMDGNADLKDHEAT